MDELKTFTVQVDPIDLDKIAESGQVFRWRALGPHEYGIIVCNATCIAKQAEKNTVEILSTEQDMQNVWKSYFDLETDYTRIIEGIDRTDKFLLYCAMVASGVRVLRQSIWETMVSFVISQNNNIPRIKKTIENMCAAFGEPIQTPWGTDYRFPEPASLTKIGEMQGMGLGYRDKYITSMAVNVLDDIIDLEKIFNADYGHAFTSLCSIYGVGPKVANCIALFSLNKTGAFPVDTWISKVTAKYYDGKFPVEDYPETAGILQQFMFYAVQHGAVQL